MKENFSKFNRQSEKGKLKDMAEIYKARVSIDRPGLIDSIISDVNAEGYVAPAPLRINDTLKPGDTSNHEPRKKLNKLKN